MDLLMNPWVIFFIVLAIIIGNMAALKNADKIRLNQKKREPSDLEKLNTIDKKRHPEAKEEPPADKTEKKN